MREDSIADLLSNTPKAKTFLTRLYGVREPSSRFSVCSIHKTPRQMREPRSRIPYNHEFIYKYTYKYGNRGQSCTQ
jgi:hypothetical protein